MLPFLVGGIALGLGKLIYDAVTEDDKPSTSSASSSGSSADEINAARRRGMEAQRKEMTSALVKTTASDVQKLLDLHKDVVTGQVKGSGATDALTEEDVRVAATYAGRRSGIDALDPLVVGLSLADSHATTQREINRMAAKRDALMKLAESL